MAKYLKPQTPLQHYNGDYIYPITSADQVLVSNGERLNANLINIDLNNSNIIPENILKPQNPMIKGSDYFYPLTTSDQVIMPDGTRLDDNVGGTKMELLWENASPDSEFAAQKISLDLNPYKFVLIESNLKPGSTQITNNLVSKDDFRQTVLGGFSEGGYYRLAQAYNTGIQFGNGYKYTTSESADASSCVPLKIYGIKE